MLPHNADMYSPRCGLQSKSQEKESTACTCCLVDAQQQPDDPYTDGRARENAPVGVEITTYGPVGAWAADVVSGSHFPLADAS